MIEDTNLLLDILGDTFTMNTGGTLRAVPAHNTAKVADYHSPYDSTKVEYTFHTTKEEADKIVTAGATSFTATKDGVVYDLLTTIPAPDGWVEISVRRTTNA